MKQRHDNIEIDYAIPFGWWGPHLSEETPKSLPWLVQSDSISLTSAAFLSLAMELQRSIIVAAELHKAGKTTLLTALVDFLPPETNRIYIRGLYERFSFVGEIPPDNALILCNEISAHLPTYLWGRGVRHLFDAVADGYPMATTMHAASGADVIDQLRNYPLGVPDEQIGKLDLIVTLGAGYVDNRFVRRVVAIERVIQRNGWIVLESLDERYPLRAASQLHVGRMVRALSIWTGMSDEIASKMLARRERRIQFWSEHGIDEPDAVRTAISRMHEQCR